jgi:hypothetical protein
MASNVRDDILLNTNPIFFTGNIEAAKKSSLEIDDSNKLSSHDPPNYFINFLCVIGACPIKRFSKLQNKLYRVFICMLICLVCIYATFNSSITSALSSAPSDDDFGDVFDLTCRSSTKMKRMKDNPCILVYSQKCNA